MSKYRIVKHQVRDVIRYCPEVWECRSFIGKCQESWWKLAGDENLTSLDLWVWSLPETIEEAKSIIEKHIEDQKPKYSEEVVYEYDTEKKEQQKKLLTEIMEADQKNGLYDISDEQTNMTAVEWLEKQLVSEGIYVGYGMYEQAKQMQKEQHEQTWNAAHQAGRFEGKGIAEENWQTFRQYYNETYKNK